MASVLIQRTNTVYGKTFLWVYKNYGSTSNVSRNTLVLPRLPWQLAAFGLILRAWRKKPSDSWLGTKHRTCFSVCVCLCVFEMSPVRGMFWQQGDLGWQLLGNLSLSNVVSDSLPNTHRRCDAQTHTHSRTHETRTHETRTQCNKVALLECYSRSIDPVTVCSTLQATLQSLHSTLSEWVKPWLPQQSCVCV